MTIFFVALARAVQRPSLSSIDAALFFGAVAFIVAANLLPAWILQGGPPPVGLAIARGAVAVFLPYLLLRLVDDFAGVPAPVRAGALLGAILVTASLLAFPPPYTARHVLLVVGYFVVVQAYNTLRYTQAIGAHLGVTRARMRAAALGSGLLATVLIFAACAIVWPRWNEFWTNLSAFAGLGCGVGYFVAFAPPTTVRRYWEAGALRQFLSSMVRLPAQSPMSTIVDIVETATADSLGAPNVVMALWDEERERLVAPRFEGDDSPEPARPETTIAARVFREQRPIAALDAVREDPENAELYRRRGASAILAAPITVDMGRRCYGVLTAFASRASIFTEDELSLLTLLAQELGGFLQRRELVLATTSIEAREEATRLKDEFLSAAAHDLRTPLTIVLGQAQLLQRHLRTRPEAIEANVEAADRLSLEAQRMRRMTDDLLDASRLEADGFVGMRRPTDVVALAQDVASAVDSPGHVVQVHGEGVTADVDPERLRQVIQNLVDNAVKFSPGGGEVTVDLRHLGDEVEICVRDDGIGIPAVDLQHLFERFYRSADVGKRGFGGMGIGLFLCKRIVEEHGGRIWAESRVGRGSEFFVRLRAAQAAREAS